MRAIKHGVDTGTTSPGGQSRGAQRRACRWKRAAGVLGVSVSSLYNLERDKTLKFRRIAGRTVVVTRGVAALVDADEEWVPSAVGAAARARRAELVRAGWETTMRARRKHPSRHPQRRLGTPKCFRTRRPARSFSQACEAIDAWLAKDRAAARDPLRAGKALERAIEQELVRRAKGEAAPRQRQYLLVDRPGHESTAVLLTMRVYLFNADGHGRHKNEAAACRRVANLLGPGIKAREMCSRLAQAFFDMSGRLALGAAYRPAANPDWARPFQPRCTSAWRCTTAFAKS